MDELRNTCTILAENVTYLFEDLGIDYKITLNTAHYLRKIYLFPSSGVLKLKDPTQLGPLNRAGLDHWWRICSATVKYHKW
jgi:hypothetical protein